MMPIAGGIGIGVVWGWLSGGGTIPKNPLQSVLFTIFTSSLLGCCVYFYEGWEGAAAYLISLSIFAVLHSLWLLHLFRIRMTRGRTKKMGGKFNGY